MKGLKWIGVGAVALIIVVAFVTALSEGERSPVFVSGHVEIAPELQNDARGFRTLFVIINDQESPMPMPLGAMKEHPPEDPSKPWAFLVTKESLMMMNPDAPLPRNLRVKVRFDMDGRAGPDEPGDLVGIVENVPFSTTDLVIKVDRKIP